MKKHWLLLFLMIVVTRSCYQSHETSPITTCELSTAEVSCYFDNPDEVRVGDFATASLVIISDEAVGYCHGVNQPVDKGVYGRVTRRTTNKNEFWLRLCKPKEVDGYGKL